jgi:hypothetical protein
MSPLFGKKQDEGGGAPDQMGAQLQAELDRLNALPLKQLASEVMAKGFGPGGPGADDSGVTTGGPNMSSGPEASDIAYEFVKYQDYYPAKPTPDDLLWGQIVRLVAEGLQELEHASLVRAQMHTDQNGFDYATTRLGRAALAQGAIDRVLGGGTL